MTALLLGVLLTGVAVAAWVWLTDNADHVGYHRSPTVRRCVLIGEEAVLMRKSEPDWG